MSEAQQPSIAHFPTIIFTSIMGMSGLSVGYYELVGTWAGFETIAVVIHSITSICLSILLVFQLIKTIKYPRVIVAEFLNPAIVGSFSTIPISFLLQAQAWNYWHITYSTYLWWTGVTCLFLINFMVFSTWLHQKTTFSKLTPIWFIPMVGNMIVGFLAKTLGQTELGWFFFSIGFMMALIMLVIMIARLIFGTPLPKAQLPSLFILMTPFAVACYAYHQLTDLIDPITRILFYGAVFFWIALASQFKYFVRLQFSLTWWAYIFPSAALVTCAYTLGHKLANPWILYFGYTVATIITLLTLYLLYKTIGWFISKKIFMAP